MKRRVHVGLTGLLGVSLVVLFGSLRDRDGRGLHEESDQVSEAARARSETEARHFQAVVEEVHVRAPQSVPRERVSAPDAAQMPARSPALRLSGSAIVTALPSSLIEVARSTEWDDRMVEKLEQFLLVTFDANGDGVLDDFERIAAVRSMRDAMWTLPADDVLAAAVEAGVTAVAPHGEYPVLSVEELRLHHDVDESRRLEHDRGSGRADLGVVIDEDFRAHVISRFQLEDDGRLTAEEYARFLRYYNRGDLLADLNLDGRVDERDLRIFLDVASPIEE